MAETIFPKPLDQEVASINAHLGTIGTIEINTENNFANSFTVTEAGKYLVIAHAAPQTASASISLGIKVGSTVKAYQVCPAGTPSCVIAVVSCAVGDVISIAPTGSISTSMTGATGWQVVKIS